jgi:hypothetical protein
MSSRLMVAAVVFRLDDIWPDWLTSKICQAEDLASHDFGYQILLTSRIWLAKTMVNFLPNFGLPNPWHDQFWP